MPDHCQFSESTFAFAYTREMISAWGPAGAVPTFPSTVAEGAAGGYDVEFPLTPVFTYFAQFKLVVRINGARGTFKSLFQTLYYQFRLRKPPSLQHQHLTRLEAESIFNVVEYVAPGFVAGTDLAAAAAAQDIVARCLRVRPSQINAVVPDVLDGKSHYVGGRSPNDMAAASTPTRIVDTGAATFREPVSNTQPVLPDEEWASAVLSKLDALLLDTTDDDGAALHIPGELQSAAGVPYVSGELQSVVGDFQRGPFGRVAAACHLFFGGDLMPVAAVSSGRENA